MYALGVILFELAGNTAVPAEGSAAGRGGPVDPGARAVAAWLDQSGTPRRRRDDRGQGTEEGPARRYRSAADLAADLRRWLDHEPILARPPSALYHLHKFARRHKGLVGGVVATGAALVLGLVGTILFAVREAHQRGQAEHNAQQAIDEQREALFQAYRARMAAAAAALIRARRGRCRAPARRCPRGLARLGMAAP